MKVEGIIDDNISSFKSIILSGEGSKDVQKYYLSVDDEVDYEGCSNMNASSFITFFTCMLRQNVIPFRKELLVTFKMAPNIKQHSLYFWSYRPLYKGHSCILKFF